MWVIVLISMVYFHIFDDYYLQGVFANLKQREWWSKNAPDELYKNDYKMALIEHGLSWSFTTMIPIMVFIIYSQKFTPKILITYVVLLVVNTVVHAFIDDKKANEHTINLVLDQLLHLIQILVTFIIFTIAGLFI